MIIQRRCVMKTRLLLLFTTSIFLSNFALAHACPSADDVNREIAKAQSYKDFKTAIQPYGELYQLATSGDFHLNHWEEFQATVKSHPLKADPLVRRQLCKFSNQSTPQ